MYLFLLSFLFLTSCQARLVFQAFDPHIPCADGSQAGIYVEVTSDINNNNSSSRSRTNPLRHILFFMGGGACTTPKDCLERYSIEPSFFGTTFNPMEVQGDTILSDSKIENPAVFDYRKTLIPYCTQDFFLGHGRRPIGNFTHGGVNVMEAALETWSRNVISESIPSLESVVVVGISAGAIAVMNNVNKIRDTIGNQTASLRFILDSPSVVSDRPYLEQNFTFFVDNYVDLDRHPFCAPDHPLFWSYRQASDLPCCLSVHCMMRHHPSMGQFYDTSTSTDHLLIFDSAYDTFEILIGTTIEQMKSTDSTVDISSREQYSDLLSMLESAGSRRMRALETAAVVKMEREASQPSRVQWLYTSCLTHTFLLSAKEFLFINCELGNFAELPFELVCNNIGQATKFRIEGLDLAIKVWRTTETWRQAEFEKQSMRQIVTDFVLDATRMQFSQEAIDVRLDCPGPNCLPLYEPKEDRPSCQAMIEIESKFNRVPWYFQLIVALPIIPVIVLLVVRSRAMSLLSTMCERASSAMSEKPIDASADVPPQDRSAAEHNPSTSPAELHLRGIRVSSPDSDDHSAVLVDNVDLYLPPRSITALCGRSGAGKSTLLRSLSQQNFGMDVQIKEGELTLSNLQKAFLRQGDHLAWANTRPCDLLLMNSKVFGANEEKTFDLFRLLVKLFHRGSKLTDLNPFLDTRIGDLSGGQRRLVSIASTLLLGTDLLLMDEPLSGLDSLSSLTLLESLRIIAKEQSVTMVLVVHQPGPELLNHFDRLVIMNAGKVVYQGPLGASHTHGDQDIVHRYLGRSFRQTSTSLRVSGFSASSRSSASPAHFYGRSSVRALSRSSKSSNLQEDIRSFIEENEEEKESNSEEAHDDEARDEEAHDEEATDGEDNDKEANDKEDATDHRAALPPRLPLANSVTQSSLEDDVSSSGDLSTSSKCTEMLRRDIIQIQYLSQRLQIDSGWELTNVLVLICAYTLIACMLLFEESFVKRLVTMSLALTVIPAVLFSSKPVGYGRQWEAHRLELDDRIVRAGPFLVATQAFSSAMPLLGIVIATLPVYLILGWSFDTFFAQVLFSILNTQVVLQVGRIAAVHYRGKSDEIVRAMVVVIIFGVLFSSIPVASWKVPSELRWLFYMSVNFWSISGSIMTHLNPSVYDNSRECMDMFTCLASDGQVLGSLLGFPQLSTPFLGAAVLSLLIVVGIFVEYLYLRHRRR